jgi:hypothetical protein
MRFPIPFRYYRVFGARAGSGFPTAIQRDSVAELGIFPQPASESSIHTSRKEKRRRRQNMKLLTISLLVLSLLAIGAHAQTDAEAAKINLGTADKFALLGASGITNVDAHTFVIADLGSYPTCAVTGLTQNQVNGQLFLKCSHVTKKAQKDLTN